MLVSDDKLCVIQKSCSHYCHNAPEGSVCSCPPDLFLQQDGKTCLKWHSCDAWGTCSQRCEQHGRRHKCSCEPGYALTADGFTCKSNGMLIVLLCIKI